MSERERERQKESYERKRKPPESLGMQDVAKLLGNRGLHDVASQACHVLTADAGLFCEAAHKQSQIYCTRKFHSGSSPQVLCPPGRSAQPGARLEHTAKVFSEAADLIHRDIAFVPSLYIKRT